MGWCGPAKPWSPPRFHTFSYQILIAWRGVIFLVMCQIHLCTLHSASITSPLTPPPLLRRLRLRLRRLQIRRRVALLQFFALFVVLSADQASSPMASAKAVSTRPFTRSPLCTSQIWSSTIVIQAPQLRARSFRPLIQPLRLFLADPLRLSVRVGNRHRIARQGRLGRFLLTVLVTPK